MGTTSSKTAETGNLLTLNHGDYEQVRRVLHPNVPPVTVLRALAHEALAVEQADPAGVWAIIADRLGRKLEIPAADLERIRIEDTPGDCFTESDAQDWVELAAETDQEL